MNVQEYISSGIVESYVLGLASAEEQREFEKNCAEYPEVLEARIAFEIALEQQAMANAIAPPADLRQQVLQATAGENDGARVIPIRSAPVARTNWFKYAIAASVILLAGSLYWNISLYNKNKQVQADYARLQNNYDTAVAKLDDIEKDIDIIRDKPTVRMAAMKGQASVPTASATVYWDSTSKDVYLLVNNLPKPASDRQYQLWALLDGKPIDLGLIPDNYFIGEKRLLLTMKNAVGAQAFAITLEKKGGSKTGLPEGDMYTLGNL